MPMDPLARGDWCIDHRPLATLYQQSLQRGRVVPKLRWRCFGAVAVSKRGGMGVRHKISPCKIGNNTGTTTWRLYCGAFADLVKLVEDCSYRGDGGSAARPLAALDIPVPGQRCFPQASCSHKPYLNPTRKSCFSFLGTRVSSMSALQILATVPPTELVSTAPEGFGTTARHMLLQRTRQA